MNEILLIAENTDIVNSFSSMLSPTYKVYAVTSEQEGFEVLKKDYNNVAAVLIELHLARKSGFSFSSQGTG